MKKNKEDLIFLLAHEFHHFYRNKLLRYDQRTVSPGDTNILWALDQLHAEGMADQINMNWWYKDSDLFGKRIDATSQYT